MSHSNPNVYGTTLQNWKSAHSQLAHAVQNYVDNCTALQAALAVPPQLPSTQHLRDRAFSELDPDLPALPAYENCLLESRLALNKLRNMSHALVPINRLPSEILDLIFSFATKKVSKPGGGVLFMRSVPACPATISSVCRLWRQKALELPSLWTHLYFTLGDPDCDFYYQRATLWADRSKDCPLYIKVREELESEEENPKLHLTDKISEVVEFLTPLMRRVYGLEIRSDRRSKVLSHSLVNCWVRHGTVGTAKVLKLSVDDDRRTLVLPRKSPRSRWINYNG
ncbi:hypothetical protein FRC08_008409 [Ceratobasidium sp. 394]|nr:hypothetical protein FRC08_008409 [Ceratobasidium sp. 394]